VSTSSIKFVIDDRYDFLCNRLDNKVFSGHSLEFSIINNTIQGKDKNVNGILRENLFFITKLKNIIGYRGNYYFVETMDGRLFAFNHKLNIFYFILKYKNNNNVNDSDGFDRNDFSWLFDAEKKYSPVYSSRFFKWFDCWKYFFLEEIFMILSNQEKYFMTKIVYIIG